MENKTKITAFKVKKIPLSKVVDNKDYEVGVSVSNWDKNRYFVILKVANKVHDDLDKDGLVKVDLYYDESFANDNNYHTLVTFTMVAQIYDAEQDKIIDTKKQDYFLNERTKEFISYSPVPVNTVEGSIQGYWHKNKLVEKVEGPFSDADCKTIVSEVKIGTRYYFRATPKQALHKSELLAMKWSYRYDDEEITPFNNALESIKGNSNLMSCIFHKQPKEIQVYAYYKQPSDKVSVKFNIFGAVKENKTNSENTSTGKNAIIFPLLVKPENDPGNKWGESKNWTAKQGSNVTTFNADRDKGKRKHAARDLYTNELETVVAVADGKVLDIRNFYAKTHQVTVLHTLEDGRSFIARYGELDPNSISVKKDDPISQKDKIGKTGKLLKYSSKTKTNEPLVVIGKTVVYMLHFECYSGELGEDLIKNPLSNSSKPYNRRSDLIDSLALLQEGYENSFGNSGDNTEENKDEVKNSFSEKDAKTALKKIHDEYGKEMAKTIEKVFRWECKHFKSLQYKNCGAPGMEVTEGKTPPNYGWDGSLYIDHPEYKPVGLWESFENVGKSGKGGNKQVTDKKKKYIKFPSVEAGMMYLVKFIQRHDGNVGRWHSTDSSVQKNYIKDINSCIPRIVNNF
jgi:hypothetical protein